MPQRTEPGKLGHYLRLRVVYLRRCIVLLRRCVALNFLIAAN
jgi:hypothetical protein